MTAIKELLDRPLPVRAALGAPSLRLDVSGPRIEGIAIGDLVIPTEADGTVRIYYSRRKPDRFVLVDVLDGEVDSTKIHHLRTLYLASP